MMSRTKLWLTKSTPLEWAVGRFTVLFAQPCMPREISVIATKPILNGDGPLNTPSDEATNHCSDHGGSPKRENLYNLFSYRSIVRALLGF
jgi:hypothetical protein